VKHHDPDATPVEGIGALRLLVDQTRGNDDETMIACPRCEGTGGTETRTENATQYVVVRAECWLCTGLGMVLTRVAVEFSRWKRRNT
jgi:hypothetical protein